MQNRTTVKGKVVPVLIGGFVGFAAGVAFALATSLVIAMVVPNCGGECAGALVEWAIILCLLIASPWLARGWEW